MPTSTRRLALLLVALLGACATRSISNPAMPWYDGNSAYQGELSDFDVTGTGPAISDAPAGVVRLQPRQRVLLVQSGAMFPDQALVSAFAEHFAVDCASGMPPRAETSPRGFADAARRGGYRAVIACWGTLESSRAANAGAPATWIPVVGMFVPGEDLQMRIRLRFVVVDTETGRWLGFSPTPVVDARSASMASRRAVDAEQVEALKLASYGPAVAELAQRLFAP